jgi:hypothetical protein
MQFSGSLGTLCQMSNKHYSEKAEIFDKMEPYLTYLNIDRLERQRADLQTKIEQLEECVI